MKIVPVIILILFLVTCNNVKRNNSIYNESTGNNGSPVDDQGCKIPGNREIEKQKKNQNPFDLTEAELIEMISGLPSKIKTRIMEKSGEFLKLIDRALTLPEKTLVLVDKDHPLPADYIPEDLVNLNTYPLVLSKKNLILRRTILPDLLEMVVDAEKEGITLVLSSCYRSYKTQERIYNWNVETYGKAQADRESAQPGKSQHQLGVTIDFGTITDEYASTPAGKWLIKNAWKYGFSLSYPEEMEWLTGYKHECWHYRYISRIGTKIEKEFFEGIQQYFLIFMNENREKLFYKKSIAN